jgi:hypothetical protein
VVEYTLDMFNLETQGLCIKEKEIVKRFRQSQKKSKFQIFPTVPRFHVFPPRKDDAPVKSPPVPSSLEDVFAIHVLVISIPSSHPG